MVVLQFLLSLIFVLQMYITMAMLALIFVPIILIYNPATYVAVRWYCLYVRFSARWIVGLRSEIRGNIPTGDVLIASKHQSFFDIIMLVSVVPRPRFIMKKELVYTPIVGWFAKRLGCIPVERGKRSAAIQKMLQDAQSGADFGGQLIIYPQGTRVAPDAYKPYKPGAAALYDSLGQVCIPTACNVGVFWPRRSLFRKRGLAIIEFLDPIEAGLEIDDFMQRVEQKVEETSDRLMLEAGFDAASARLKN